jgi:hypothetical protein
MRPRIPKYLFAALMMAAFVGAPSHAEEALDANAIVRAVLPCLNLPPGSKDIAYSVTIELTMDPGGTPTDIVVTSYQPDTNLGVAIANAAARALARCNPIKGAPTHSILVFDPSSAEEEGMRIVVP